MLTEMTRTPISNRHKTGRKREYVQGDEKRDLRGVVMVLARHGTDAPTICTMLFGNPRKGKVGHQERTKHLTFVKRWAKKAATSDATGRDAAREGRPLALPPATVAKIPRMLKQKRTRNAVLLSKKLDVSHQTIKNRAHEAGLACDSVHVILNYDEKI